MKKLALTIAIVLGLSMTTFAEDNQGGGLFHRGATPEKSGNREGRGITKAQKRETKNGTVWCRFFCHCCVLACSRSSLCVTESMIFSNTSGRSV